MNSIKNYWREESTIFEMQEAMDAELISSKQLVLYFLHRIASFDSKGLAINSIAQINPDALHIAESLDRERKLTGARGHLHGIPILLKDNIDTDDKMNTSAGSLVLGDSYAADDAFVVKQLRKAGAVILGKTNMTEFANYMAENMPSGYSSKGGQVLNPYGPGKFDVGGSSSGSGAAIAANFAAAAIGTETSGSILNPAINNSLVGIKPTVGLVSRDGIIPIAFSQDVAGPMARNVSDAAILLSSITGIDHEDPSTAISIGQTENDYSQFLDKDGLKGAKIGVFQDVEYDCVSERKLIQTVIDVMREEGATIVESITIPSYKSDWDWNVLDYEFKPAINAYLKKLNHGHIRTLEDIISFNDSVPEKALKYGQHYFLQSQSRSGALTEAEYIHSRANDISLSRDQGIDYAIDKYDVDVILFPSDSGADIAARAGYPSISVPCGFTTDGKPYGFTLTGKAFTETQLIKIAYSYEQKTKHRQPPRSQLSGA
ncbi:amidase family protein [Bacillus sp. SCS-151]|uniref:amidase family protein n=1 Tax=Nanhaiella sioensis TaxID=3115293 RepID=UPI00397BB2F0